MAVCPRIDARRDFAAALVLAFAFAAAGPACGGGGSAFDQGEIGYFDGTGVRNMAHRGGSGIAPENTLLAFETGIEAGATIIETDVHTTSDGVIVILHDDTVDRTTDGEGPVHGMTLAEVKSLDAAYRFTTDGGATTPYRGKGIRIPTLEEAFDRFPRERFNIEVKQFDPSMEEQLLDLVHEKGMERQVLIAATSDASLAKVRQLDPEIPTNAGPLEIIRFIVQYPDIPAENPILAKAFQIPEELPLVFPEFIPNARQAGIEVHLWTVNERANMERAVALGADGVISDYPDVLAEVLRASGI